MALHGDRAQGAYSALPEVVAQLGTIGIRADARRRRALLRSSARSTGASSGCGSSPMRYSPGGAAGLLATQFHVQRIQRSTCFQQLALLDSKAGPNVEQASAILERVSGCHAAAAGGAPGGGPAVVDHCHNQAVFIVDRGLAFAPRAGLYLPPTPDRGRAHL